MSTDIQGVVYPCNRAGGGVVLDKITNGGRGIKFSHRRLFVFEKIGLENSSARFLTYYYFLLCLIQRNNEKLLHHIFLSKNRSLSTASYVLTHVRRLIGLNSTNEDSKRQISF